MESLLLLIIVAIGLFIFHMINYKKSKKGTVTIREWHQLGPVSKRFDSKSINSGYIYFVQESGNNRIKIGKAKNPESRIQNDFGTIMPYEFKVLHLIKSENYHKTENLFHNYFKNKRFKGEWFNLTNNDVNWIEKGDYPRDIEDSIKGY